MGNQQAVNIRARRLWAIRSICTWRSRRGCCFGTDGSSPRAQFGTIGPGISQIELMSGLQAYVQSFGQVWPASIEHAIARNSSEDEGQPCLPRTAGPSIIAGKIAQLSRAFRRACQKETGATWQFRRRRHHRVRCLEALGISSTPESPMDLPSQATTMSVTLISSNMVVYVTRLRPNMVSAWQSLGA